MPQAVTIRSLPRAFAMIKAMQDQGYEWREDYRQCGREALVEILEEQMDDAIDRQLVAADIGGAADRRNGSYHRHLLTELGDIELSVPRARGCSALSVVRAYARRAPHLDRMILSCFVFGLSTRKVATALLPVLGRPVSPQTVSRVAKTLSREVVSSMGIRLETSLSLAEPRHNYCW
jgi:transposase-like protein